MRTSAALAVLALLAVTLAGCSSDDPERYPDGVPSSSSTSRSASASATATGSSTGTSTGPGAPANRAPVGALKATLNGTAATFEVNGTDADNDTLSWTLSFGDGNSTNGTTLPATLQHNYTLPANTTALNVTARLTLSDGRDNATYDAKLNVSAGAESVTLTVAWEVGSAWCVNYPYNLAGETTPFEPGTPAAGVLYGELAIDPAWVGRPFTADFGSPATPMDAGIVGFYDAANAFVDLAGSEGGLNGPPATAADPMVASGTVPVGAAVATFMNCAAPEGATVSFTVA